MINYYHSFNPDLVLLPCSTDIHQDHVTLFNEGFRAYKKCSLLGFEAPWNNLDFRTSSFVKVEERHLQKKIKALSHYKSQAFRDYASENFVRSLAVTRGTQIGVEFAEAFEIIRFIFK
jgi:LmbE family N-acetylglucosaminyl deacetylase